MKEISIATKFLAEQVELFFIGKTKNWEGELVFLHGIFLTQGRLGSHSNESVIHLLSKSLDMKIYKDLKLARSLTWRDENEFSTRTAWDLSEQSVRHSLDGIIKAQPDES